MKKLLPILSILLLTPCLIKPASSQLPAPASPLQSPGLNLNLDILSDTNGANLSPYIKTLASDLKKHWLPLANTANQPPLKQQETAIDITIAPDGHIQAMQLEDSTHNTALDKAAWSAAKETTYLPPPAGIKDQTLKLRVHFTVN
jgi:TonB family protein